MWLGSLSSQGHMFYDSGKLGFVDNAARSFVILKKMDLGKRNLLNLSGKLRGCGKVLQTPLL